MSFLAHDWCFLVEGLFFAIQVSGQANKQTTAGEAAYHRGSILASHPAAPGSIASVPEFFSDEKLSMLLRLINGTG